MWRFVSRPQRSIQLFAFRCAAVFAAFLAFVLAAGVTFGASFAAGLAFLGGLVLGNRRERESPECHRQQGMFEQIHDVRVG